MTRLRVRVASSARSVPKLELVLAGIDIVLARS